MRPLATYALTSILLLASEAYSVDREVAGSLVAVEERDPDDKSLFLSGFLLVKDDGSRIRFGPWRFIADGETLVQFHDENGRMAGPSTVLSAQNELVVLSHVNENGVDDGPRVEMYDNGAGIKRVQSYRHGRLHGTDTLFRKNGIPYVVKSIMKGYLPPPWWSSNLRGFDRCEKWSIMVSEQ